MAVFAISSRRIVGQGDRRRFDGEPGLAARFLIAPDGASEFLPAHIVRGAGARTRWTDAVLNTFAKARDPLTRKDVYTGDLVFLVHGYNVDAKAAAARHHRFHERLTEAGFPHTLVSYDWPSQGSLLNYLEDSIDAFKSAPLLVESGISLFAGASRPDCKVRVHVVAHSMGAYVAREAFRQAKGHAPARQGAWGVSQLVLIAADISARSIHAGLSEEMRARAQRITSYFSRYDGALATSNIKRFASSPRLGRHGATGPGNVTHVDCSARWLAFSKTDANANCIADIALSHTWYFDDCERFYPDLAGTLIGDIDRNLLPTRDMSAGGLRLRA